IEHGACGQTLSEPPGCYADGSPASVSSMRLEVTCPPACRICRCRLPSWIQRAEHFTQKALGVGERTTTTLADSHTGHLTNATSVSAGRRGPGRSAWATRMLGPDWSLNLPLAPCPKHPVRGVQRAQPPERRTASCHRL